MPEPQDRPSLQRRLLHPRDFTQALDFLPAWLALPAEMRAQLPRLWAALLQHPGFNADVIEDVAAPPARRMQALGMSIAVNAAWARRLRTGPSPWVTREFYADLLAGRTQPPSAREMAQANASTGADGGLTFLVLHYQQRNMDLQDPQAVALVSAGLAAMQQAHAGHRVRELFQEAWQAERAYMDSIGLVQRTAHNAAVGDDRGSRPELFSLDRAEVLHRLPGSQVREIFEHRTPLFSFRGAEQRLLRRALFDESDEAVAALLGVSTSSLKKLWRSIYERVEDHLPGLFDEGVQAEGVRGPEKRRKLMSYLRQHPEELRPWR